MVRLAGILLSAATQLAAAATSATAPAGGGDPPQYTAGMYLEDSLYTADAIVEAEVDDDAGRLRVKQTLWGTLQGERHGEVSLCNGSRTAPRQAGAFILLRTRNGYFSMNPQIAPLAPEAGRQLARRAPPQMRWEEDADQAALTLRCTTNRDGRAVRRSRVVYNNAGEVTVEEFADGALVLRRSWDSTGRLLEVFRLDGDGNGLHIEWHGDHIVACARYAGGVRDGVSLEYYRHNPRQVRRETTWRRGVRDGPQRTWSEDGRLVEQIAYEDGFVAPVARYAGPPPEKPIATVHKGEMGVFYRANVPLDGLFRVGMTVQEAMEVLRLDFSPTEGILFPFYRPDRYLHIAFADGKISAIRTGDNSRCFERR